MGTVRANQQGSNTSKAYNFFILQNRSVMGKQKNMHFQGRIGDIIYYPWRDIWCMRLVQRKVYQDDKVKAQGKANGLSTKMGSSLRGLLAGAIPFPKSFSMQTAFRKALRLWLQTGPALSETPANDIPYIGGFSFNEAVGLQKCLHVPLTLTLQSAHELVLHIPSLVPVNDITAPATASIVQLKVIAACCDITTAMPISSSAGNITMPYDKNVIPADDIPLTLQMPTRSITLVVVALQFYTNNYGNLSRITDERFQPSQVTGVLVR